MMPGWLRNFDFAALRRKGGGMSLVEAVISLGIVSVMLVASLKAVGSSVRARQIHASQRRRPILARELMSEILPRHYAELDGVAIFGPESSESIGDRSQFDDVDDYHNWSAQPPCDRDGTALPALALWQRSVVVEYVDPDDPGSVVGTDMGLKRITVTVTDPSGRTSELVSLRSSYGVYDHPPSEDTTYVTRVGVDLQIGSDNGARMISAANPLNRVAVEGQ